jgi:hypothetical protein
VPWTHRIGEIETAQASMLEVGSPFGALPALRISLISESRTAARTRTVVMTTSDLVNDLRVSVQSSAVEKLKHKDNAYYSTNGPPRHNQGISSSEPCRIPSRRPVTAVMIVKLALLNDGSILSIAYDNVHYKQQPEAWNMRLVLGMAAVLGLVGPIAAFGLFYMGNRVFHLNHPHLQTLINLLLSVAGSMTIYLTRTRGPFWSIRPARVLVNAVTGAQAGGDAAWGIRDSDAGARVGSGRARVGLRLGVVPRDGPSETARVPDPRTSQDEDAVRLTSQIATAS